MKYLTERSLYYYFLMGEVTDADGSAWNFIAKNFGVKPKDIKAYEDTLSNKTLTELTTPNDIEMYRNYLNGFCRDLSEFGKTSNEQDAINAKALALHKSQEIFGDMRIKNNRLRRLSHNYGDDHIGSVLYALQMLYLNSEKECVRFAEEILTKELEDGKNSDAGLVLLRLKSDEANDVAARLKSLPDMLLRPDMLKYLTEQYGSGEIIFKDKRVIGF